MDYVEESASVQNDSAYLQRGDVKSVAGGQVNASVSADKVVWLDDLMFF